MQPIFQQSSVCVKNRNLEETRRAKKEREGGGEEKDLGFEEDGE